MPPPAPPFRPDPDLVAACNATAAVYVDANRAASSRGLRGAAEPDWQPVPGLSAVRLVLGQGGAAVEDVDGLPVQAMKWMALFPYPIELNVNNYIKVHYDTEPGKDHALFVTGGAENAFGTDHHWYCQFTEYPAAP